MDEYTIHNIDKILIAESVKVMVDGASQELLIRKWSTHDKRRCLLKC